MVSHLFVKKLKNSILTSQIFALNHANEPVLIEANLFSGELDFHQLNNVLISRDDTVKILNEVFGKIPK